ncbi:hypothetical protein DDIC_11475 [Desulfovibrio desulfuricans]|uniref:Uncharacterized protein n=1 Tax=Desulfovibrio desulfuricans TaxID=876 RepID=A0A4P7US13_DESDE|nr:hypothetical protein [Desulfovibrio desulfuricans]QCC86482.1 hypothetical protein DDIC_11475 [Desulfovibrio desulfuricans]
MPDTAPALVKFRFSQIPLANLTVEKKRGPLPPANPPLLIFALIGFFPAALKQPPLRRTLPIFVFTAFFLLSRQPQQHFSSLSCRSLLFLAHGKAKHRMNKISRIAYAPGITFAIKSRSWRCLPYTRRSKAKAMAGVEGICKIRIFLA